MTKQPTHCMIDLETLDLKPSSKIVSIGAVMFDPNHQIIGDKFYKELDHKAQEGRTSDPETVKWWKTQPKNIREALKGTAKLPDILEDFAWWLPADVKVWGNGSIFDIAMMEDAYRQYDIEIPWKFWNVLDMRTVKAVYEADRGGWEKANGANKHNALADALHQAEATIKMWQTILKVGK